MRVARMGTACALFLTMGMVACAPSPSPATSSTLPVASPTAVAIETEAVVETEAAGTPVPPNFACGMLRPAECAQVARLILTPPFPWDPGQRLAAARVEPTSVKVCPSAGDAKPVVDVVVLLSEPVAQVRITIAQVSDGAFTTCSY
jgi:hypothetical protein